MVEKSGRKEHERYQGILRNLSQRTHDADDVNVKKRGADLHQSTPRFTKTLRQGNRERLLSLLIPFSLIFLGAIYVLSPFSKVAQITVAGRQNLTASQVTQATTIKQGDFIWRWYYQRDQISSIARRHNRQIDRVKLELTGPRSLKIVVKEYPIVGLVQQPHGNRYLLASGKYIPAPAKPKTFIRYQGYGKHTKLLTKTAQQVGQVSAPIRNGISEIVYSPVAENPERVIIYMNDGNTVYVRLSTLATKLRYYPSITSKMKQKGVVDLQYAAYSYAYGSQQPKANKK